MEKIINLVAKKDDKLMFLSKDEIGYCWTEDKDEALNVSEDQTIQKMLKEVHTPWELVERKKDDGMLYPCNL